MEEPVHPFHELFDQLGLPSDKAGIEAFIAGHAPLPDDVRVEEGNAEYLIGKLQERYGLAKDVAKKEVNDFVDSL